MTTKPSRSLEVFATPCPERDYLITIRLPEFTCLCPLSGQLAFGRITLAYIADQQCVELKALKLYIWSYRDDGAFHEAVTNQILDDVVKACAPRFARLTAAFNVRGGTYPQIVAEHRANGWSASAASVLPAL